MSKILFLLEDYNYFYTHGMTALANHSYEQALHHLISQKHYQADSLAFSFRKMGHTTQVIVPECNPLQLKWAKEHSILRYARWLLEAPIRSIKSRWLKQYRTSYNTIQFNVLLKQVKQFKPDVLYFYANIYITEDQIQVLKKYVKKIVLQWSSPLWAKAIKYPYHRFDVIVTSALQLKSYFDGQTKCVYMPQAFDRELLHKLPPKPTAYKGDVIFIGSFTLGHHYRYELIEHLLNNNIDLALFGIGRENLPPDSKSYNKMQTPLYGLNMYAEYQHYKIAIHIHTTGIDNDGFDWNKYAGAKRVFEITGVGTMLITSQQENIGDMFKVDEEIVAFKDKDDLLHKIKFYLHHDDRREQIAMNGMRRTRQFHTFDNRAMELSKYL